MNLSSVAEVEECGRRRANLLLSLGFTLLAIDGRAFEANRRTPIPGGPDTYIRRDLTYVIGRTAEQPAFPERYPTEAPATPQDGAP